MSTDVTWRLRESPLVGVLGAPATPQPCTQAPVVRGQPPGLPRGVGPAQPPCACAQDKAVAEPVSRLLETNLIPKSHMASVESQTHNLDSDFQALIFSFYAACY